MTTETDTPLPAPAASNPEMVRIVIADLQQATKAAFDLLAELTAARSDGDEWTRLPRPDARCPVSGFSRSKVNSLIAEDKIRAKTVSSGRYYSLSDMRAFIRNTAANN